MAVENIGYAEAIKFKGNCFSSEAFSYAEVINSSSTNSQPSSRKALKTLPTKGTRTFVREWPEIKKNTFPTLSSSELPVERGGVMKAASSNNNIEGVETDLNYSHQLQVSHMIAAVQEILPADHPVAVNALALHERINSFIQSLSTDII